jgi:hypothetical protein
MASHPQADSQTEPEADPQSAAQTVSQAVAQTVAQALPQADLPRQATASAAPTGVAAVAAPPAALAPGNSLFSRRLPLAALLIAASWILAVAAYYVHADAILIIPIVYGTGGLLRVGGTVLDRLMLTLGLLAGTAITAGIPFSLWPFGLNPIAVGGTALTVLILLGTLLRRRPRWPHRMLGSDIALLGGFAVSAAVAFGPLWRGNAMWRLGYAGLTGDRLRDFSLFDAIHRIGGYPFLMQNQSAGIVEPGMRVEYPPGMHLLYALTDIFVTSRTDPGNPVNELMRYEYYTCLGYGFFVLCVAWAARWAAGPAMAGWRRTFTVSAIVCFLSAGVMTTAIWCGWDPQILGMGLLALLAAVVARPPRRGREHIILVAALCVAIFMTYELFAPFAAILVLVSGAVYRKRWLPHWRFAAVVAVISIPVALSQLFAAHEGGLSSSSLALSFGFSVQVAKQSLAIIAVLAVAGFATSRARRRPSALVALANTVLCGCGVIAFWAYQHLEIHTTSYYYEKTIEAWACVALVAVGSAGHLLGPRLWKGFGRIPSRGIAGAMIGCLAIVAGLVVTDSVPYGRASFDYAKMRVGGHTTWAQVWIGGRHIYPNDPDALAYLNARGLVGDGVPTVVLWGESYLDNINLSLMLATLNHDQGVITSVDNNIGSTDALFVAGEDGKPWTKAQLKALTQLEHVLSASPVPLRVLVSNSSVADKLGQWAAAHPQHHLSVVYLDGLPSETRL